MKPAVFDYARPETLAEALALRGQHGSDSAVLAGGQSLMPMLNLRLARPEMLIDLGAARELAYVRPRDGGIAVGAMARQRDVELAAQADGGNPLIAETLRHVAHGVVRNRGTVCGSIAHADAAAELPTLFATLGGVARVASAAGERTVTGADLFAFHLTSTLEPDELLREVWLPDLEPGAGWAFTEFARRHGDYALAGVCAVVVLGDGDTIARARLGYCGVAPTPVRADAAERALAGAAAGEKAYAEAARLAEDVVEAPDDIAASQAFRRHLVNRLTQRALRTASQRARERSER
ncbi:MAG: FAD binding domain-containing protein [Solirubrobacteraceae bacterium]